MIGRYEFWWLPLFWLTGGLVGGYLWPQTIWISAPAFALLFVGTLIDIALEIHLFRKFWGSRE